MSSILSFLRSKHFCLFSFTYVKRALFALCLFCATVGVWGQTTHIYTWKGGTSNNWEDKTNWNPEPLNVSAFLADDIFIIPNGFTVNLKLQNPTNNIYSTIKLEGKAILNIECNGSLNIHGPINTAKDGTLKIEETNATTSSNITISSDIFLNSLEIKLPTEKSYIAIGANITTTGNQTYNGNVTISKSVTLNASRGNIQFDSKVGTTGTNTLTVSGNNVTFKSGVSDNSSIKIENTGNVIINGDNTFSQLEIVGVSDTTIGGSNTFTNFIIDNQSRTTEATTVKFAESTTQKIATYSFKGKDETKRLTLTSNNTNKWKVCFQNGAQDAKFQFVSVGYSVSTDANGKAKDLGIFQKSATVQDVNKTSPTCENWWRVAKVNSISLVSKPSKTNYIEGQTFDPSGLVIEITYDIGTEDKEYNSSDNKFNIKFVGGRQLDTNTKLQAGDSGKKITVSYDGKEIPKNKQFSLTVTKNNVFQVGGVTIKSNVININTDGQTTLEVDMRSSGSLTVLVMTMGGSVIKSLHRGNASEGTHTFTWDGRNMSGSPVARGIYFIRIVAPGIEETRKVMVVK